MIVEHLREFQTKHVAKTAADKTNLAGTRKRTHESFSECPGKVNNREKAHSLSSSGIHNKKLQLEPNDVESTSQNHQTIDDFQVKQCSLILEKLMNNKFGWIFNQPVDPVKLMIPDYFSIISKPMDLGTIKNKLETMEYNFVTEFVDDVRLTFANAMRYNPPSNDVHIIAKKLNNIFHLCCKSLKEISEKQKIQTLQRKTNKKVHPLTMIVQRESANCPASYAQKPLRNLGSQDAKTECRQHITRPMFKDSASNIVVHTADLSATTNPEVTSTENELFYEDWLPPIQGTGHFDETIFKAQQKTLQDAEKTYLENKQKSLKIEKEHEEDMARLDAQIKDSAEAELKLQREKAREASRLILQNIEKTVDIHENYGLLKDVQSLHYGYSKLHPVTFEEEMVNLSDGVELLGTSGDPLEQYWWFMKDR